MFLKYSLEILFIGRALLRQFDHTVLPIFPTPITAVLTDVPPRITVEGY